MVRACSLPGRGVTVPSAMIDKRNFENYADIIRSGQMPDADVPRFMEENPDFKAWYLRVKNLGAGPGESRELHEPG